MKAKEYYDQLVACQTDDELATKIEEIMNSLSNDVDVLIKTRHAQTHDAISSVVLEVNKKWLAMVKLSKSDTNKIVDKILYEDAFYICFSDLRPQYKRYFEKKVDAAKKYMENIYKQEKEREDKIKNMSFHRVMPLNEVTKTNIYMETMSCTMSMSNFFQTGMKLETLRPLGERIAFLRYWIDNGINYEEIKDFELNGAEFLKAKQLEMF